MTNICPVCGEVYFEPPAISRLDNKTKICSSCGIRQSLKPLLEAGIMKPSDIEELVQKNKELCKKINGT